MAIDTIILQSPYITENIANRIEKECMWRMGMNLKENELVYSITTGELAGSFDARLQIKIERQEWTEGDWKEKFRNGKRPKVKIPCKPYLRIGASVHKLIAGHNIYGGPKNFLPTASWLIDFVSEAIGMKMPEKEEWKPERIDVTHVYQLSGPDAILEYFRGLNRAEYARRSINRYGLKGLQAPGTTTSQTFYHKGPEFRTHDKKRLRGKIPENQIEELQAIADSILRVECQIKSRKLKYDHGDDIRISQITDDYLENIHNIEVRRILKEGAGEMKQVRRSESVGARLIEVYGESLGGIYLGTWSRLAIFGERKVKNEMKETTFYRHKKALRDANCSWNSTDVVVRDFHLVPEDFIPLPSDVRCISNELPVISHALEKYKAS